MENSDIFEIERSLLACIAQNKNAIDQVAEIIKPESFSNELHQQIFSAMMELYFRSEPIDILILVNMLKNKGALENTGGIKFLKQYLNIKADIDMLPFLYSSVEDAAIKRDLLQLSEKIREQALDQGISGKQLIGETEEELRKIYLPVIKHQYKKLDKLVSEAMEQIIIASGRGESDITIPSGFISFDKITGGFRKGNLSIIGGRPAMGKTAFLISLAKNISFENRVPLAYFSLECNSHEITLRLMAQILGNGSFAIRNGNIPKKELDDFSELIKNNEIPFYCDSSVMNIKELVIRIKTICKSFGIKMVIIDYLQLIGFPDKKRRSRVEEIDHIIHSLKQLAKELDISIIVASQLSRAVEARGGSKRPILSDLRESGTIEDEADFVTFIYRPEYYMIEYYEDCSPTKNMAEIVVAKNRNGAIGDFRFSFDRKTGLFKEIRSIDRQDYQELRADEFDDDNAPF